LDRHVNKIGWHNVNPNHARGTGRYILYTRKWKRWYLRKVSGTGRYRYTGVNIYPKYVGQDKTRFTGVNI
jgi:hypothetical protein